jgi:heterodisulfide reductase subunit A-like polyferredoxin
MAPTLKVVGSLLAAASTVSAGFSLPTFLYKDVVVVGGGAGGVYSTVRLKEDYGKSVVLIEKTGRLVSNPTRLLRFARRQLTF